MNNGLSDAEIRRARLQCHIAASVFAACAVGLALAPIEMSPAIRWVAAGFNVIIALAVFLYARTVGAES